MSTHDERMERLYSKPCSNCGCTLEGQQGISPNLAYWEHRTTDGCVRALARRVARLEAEGEERAA